MPDGPLREIIVWTETCYFTVLAFTLLLALVRCLGFELARHFRHRRILQLLNSPLVFFLAVFIVSAAYMVPSVHGATTLRTVTYDIALDKSCGTDTFSIAVISDFHVGAGARLFMNDDGIGVRRFGKVKTFIRWNEVKEIGIGNIPTPFGSKERAYFCDRTLDENERTDLVTLKYHTVHFSYIPKEWYGEMCARLPLPLPPEIKEKYVR